MTTQENIAVVYTYYGYEQRGSLDADAVVYITNEPSPSPRPFAEIEGRVIETTAAAWQETPSSFATYIRHKGNAIPVRLAGGAS